ncbi:MAG: cobalamin-dependent protein, partial [bacterium]
MISTQEVASMLNVAETTVKRWSDEGTVPCVRTPGGHRKFHLKDIVQFAETNGYTITGGEPPPMTKNQQERLAVGVHTKNYESIAEVFKEEALQADQKGLLELLLYLHKHQISFPTMADNVISPAFKKIGILWEQRRLEISQEHVASHTLAQALARMTSEIHKKEFNGMTAVCACPEGELHENGLRCVANTLEVEGFKVHFIGANTPFDTLMAFVKATKVDLVCLSLSELPKQSAFLPAIKKLKTLVNSHGGNLVLGGHFVETKSTQPPVS